jgi:hypothetical protein
MTVKSIQDNGTNKVKQKRGMDYKYGQIDQNLKDSGKMIWLMDLADSF